MRAQRRCGSPGRCRRANGHNLVDVIGVVVTILRRTDGQVRVSIVLMTLEF